MKKSLIIISQKTTTHIKINLMSLSLKNNRKKHDSILTLSFLKEMSKKNKVSSNRTVNLDSNSSEIAEMISEKLLRKVEKQLTLKKK